VLTKGAQDLAKPIICFSFWYLSNQLPKPFSFFLFSNDIEFLPVSLDQELVLVSFLDFLRIPFSNCKEDGLSADKKLKEMKGISNAHGAAEAPSCQEQGLCHTHHN
jgi:hypothetical protein